MENFYMKLNQSNCSLYFYKNLKIKVKNSRYFKKSELGDVSKHRESGYNSLKSLNKILFFVLLNTEVN